ncbi:MAG: magnesium transporter [Lachnospiraceae bacterium]|nr:magnesium transporter [Clostridiales bacterium]MDD6293186.1 magnesium transporter [Eubacteriales bacterium]MDY2607168.1 magnesium transporter [Lachnospiraceae bacterium]
MEAVKTNIDEFIDAVEKKDKSRMDKLYEHIEAIDIAVSFSNTSEKIVKNFCKIANDEKIADILEQADEKVQKKIIAELDNYRILYIFNYMQKDDIVDILSCLPIDRSKQIVNLMREGDKKVIQELLGYSQDSAGGIMTTEYIALNGNMTIKAAMVKIKNIAPKTEVIESIFVIDSKRELIGIADLRDILISNDDVILKDIADKEYISVEPETDQEEVSMLVSKYDLKVIPVLDKRKALIGIITVDDIIDVIEEEHTEDMYGLAGVSKEENLDSSISESIKLRLPWLIINLFTAFLAAAIIKIFESTIEQVVALSATMSIVTGMGGNAGTQTLSIMVRSIAIGDINGKQKIKLIMKEVGLGLINGSITGLITGIIVYFMYGNIYLGVIIFLAMIANLIISGFFGIIIPLVLMKCKADPALASSIFLTTATDVLGFFVFLGLAHLMLPYLL